MPEICFRHPFPFMPTTTFPALIRRLLPLAALMILVVYFSIAARGPGGETLFLAKDNLFNIARQQSVILLIAFGMTLVIISGGIDLSVGSVAAFCGVVAAWITLAPSADPTKLGGFNASVPVGIAAGILCGALWGSANSLLIGVFRLPPFIATLGVMGIARGLAYIMSRGQSVDLPSLEIDQKTGIDPNLLPGGNQFLGNGDILGMPIPLLLIILSALLCWLILNKSVVGRSIYAVGGNPQAARFAGIDERKVLFFVYTMAGALTGLAAMIEVSRGTSAQPNSGADYPLDSIAAVVIGGGSLLGGVGNISGTIIGALVIAVLRNGSNLLGVDPFLQMVFIGVLIIAAVALDQWQKKA